MRWSTLCRYRQRGGIRHTKKDVRSISEYERLVCGRIFWKSNGRIMSHHHFDLDVIGKQ